MGASSFNNKIHQSGRFRSIEMPITSASATIYPGMLLEMAATGLQAHGTAIGSAAGWAEKIIAQEDALQGCTVYGFENLYSNSYTGYTYAGFGGNGPDMVFAYIEDVGSLCLGLLKVNFNYTVGMGLISDGAGHFKPTSASTDRVLATVVTAINLSVTSTGNSLSLIRII